MMETTLCYLEQDGKYLMLYRNAKASDPNKGKWIGVGGKIQPGETPDECLVREVKEETGLTLTTYQYRGIIYFKSDVYPDETMHLYTATAWKGTLTECDEGQLRWVEKKNLETLPMWEGDLVFLRTLDRNHAFFRLTLNYQNERLISTQLEC